MQTARRPFDADPGFTMIELIVVIAIVGVIAATAVPMMGSVLGGLRLSGDARGLANTVALAKMQASANFTRARVYVDLTTGGYQTDLWQKTGGGSWVTQTATRYLSASGESFGFGTVGTPPANTQGTIALAPQCTNDAGAAIGNTSCIIFNSRGVPVDNAGAPTGVDAFYVTDGTKVYGMTVSATGLLRFWQTDATGTPNWQQK